MVATGETAGTERAPFGARLAEAMAAHGPLCAGIDPHRALVEGWGLPYTVSGVERFTMTCVEAFAGVVAAVKPQSAFFEVFGARGIALLEKATEALREVGTIVILDVKRGDIGTTMEAYAQAFLADDAPAPVDAITVNPYLGYGALRPAIDLAHATGRGVFALALTSNPDGPSVQHAVREGRSVAATVVDGATVDNAAARAQGRLGDIGLVVGATVGSAVSDLGLDLVTANTPILAPGFGAQGATAADAEAVFGAARRQVLGASSRDVLRAGPEVTDLRARAVEVADSLAAVLG